MNFNDALLRYVPVIMALASIVWGWIWLGAPNMNIPIAIGNRRVFLKGKAITFFRISIIVLGILILGFVIANILWFDTGKQTETTIDGHPALVRATSLRIWNVTWGCGISYMIAAGAIAVWINRVYEEDKQKEKPKRKPKPKRKNDWL